MKPFTVLVQHDLLVFYSTKTVIEWKIDVSRKRDGWRWDKFFTVPNNTYYIRVVQNQFWLFSIYKYVIFSFWFELIGCCLGGSIPGCETYSIPFAILSTGVLQCVFYRLLISFKIIYAVSVYLPKRENKDFLISAYIINLLRDGRNTPPRRIFLCNPSYMWIPWLRIVGNNKIQNLLED